MESVYTMETFAYIRVSSKDQNIDRQLNEMKELGINERYIFIDKESGKDFNRDQYQLMKRIIRKGDLLYIKSIDRFGRNSKEIKKEWEDITSNLQADIKVLDMPLLDTTQYKDTLGTFVSDLVLQVLAFVAEKEREDIRKRQREGIEAAKKKGKHLGRPVKNLSTLDKDKLNDLKLLYPQWKEGNITSVYFMKKLELTKNTFYKIIKEYGSNL